ncbi:MAG: tol-pal system protein YbgF [Xanthomonadaceae bacterium]|nr:tol-pal system protein YbgF [Xanthomonadaceae bacterium]
MNIRHQHFFLALVLVIICGTGCVTDQSYVQLDDTVRNLQQRVDSVESRQAESQRKTGAELQRLNADVNVRLDSLETEVQIMNANLEENHRTPRELPAVEAKDVQLVYERLDARLKQLEISVQQLQQQAGNGPAAVKPPLMPGRATTTPSPATNPQKKEITKSVATAGAREKAFYDDAYAVFKRGDYSSARKKFTKFLTAFPQSMFRVNALFWIAECSYKEKQYEEAIIKYDQIITKYPHNPKIPSTLLKQGFSFLMLGDKTDGKIILEKVIADYPNSDQAEIARRKLKVLGK